MLPPVLSATRWLACFLAAALHSQTRRRHCDVAALTAQPAFKNTAGAAIWYLGCQRLPRTPKYWYKDKSVRSSVLIFVREPSLPSWSKIFSLELSASDHLIHQRYTGRVKMSNMWCVVVEESNTYAASLFNETWSSLIEQRSAAHSYACRLVCTIRRNFLTFFSPLTLYKSRQLERSHLSLISLTAGAEEMVPRERERERETGKRILFCLGNSFETAKVSRVFLSQEKETLQME